MVKPILAIYYCIDGISDEAIVRNLKSITEIAKRTVSEEYYVFALPTKKDSFIQVFYEKDFDTIKYAELSDKLLIEVKKITNETT